MQWKALTIAHILAFWFGHLNTLNRDNLTSAGSAPRQSPSSCCACWWHSWKLLTEKGASWGTPGSYESNINLFTFNWLLQVRCKTEWPRQSINISSQEEKSYLSSSAKVGKIFKPVMWRGKLLDDIVDFDESFFISCCWNSILQRVKLERHVNRQWMHQRPIHWLDILFRITTRTTEALQPHGLSLLPRQPTNIDFIFRDICVWLEKHIHKRLVGCICNDRVCHVDRDAFMGLWLRTVFFSPCWHRDNSHGGVI